MRIHPFLWAPDDRTGRGPVGTTSGSGGSEYFVTPEESARAHLKAPLPEGAGAAPTETTPLSESGNLEGTEAGPDNPVRGLD